MNAALAWPNQAAMTAIGTPRKVHQRGARVERFVQAHPLDPNSSSILPQRYVSKFGW